MRATGNLFYVAAASLVGCQVHAAPLGAASTTVRSPGAQISLSQVLLALTPLGAQAPAPGPRIQPYQWRNAAIVAGGFVPGIVFSPRQPNLIYARTDIGGAYRWDQGNRRWIPLTDWIGPADWNLMGIESVAPDPMDANRVYLAAGTYTQSWAGNGAILRSADQGRTWQRTDMPFKMGGNEDGRSIGERLSIDPNKNSILYFGSRSDGLWKSVDYAATWTRVSSFPVTGRTNGIGIGFILFDRRTGSPGNPTRTLYAGVAAPGVNLYRSTDEGNTWEAVAGQPQGLLPHHGFLAADGALYLTYGSGPGPNGMTGGAVWKYNTGSGAWKDITPLKPGIDGEGRFGYAGLGVDAAHPDTLMVATMDRWASGDDILRSTDGGSHWAPLKPKALRDSSLSPYLNFGGPSPALGHWIGALAIDPFNPDHVLYGTGATIWGTEDATAADRDQPTHWTVWAPGLEETAVIDLASPPSGAHLLSGLGDIGGFRHDDLAVSPRTGMWTNPLMSNTDSIDFAENHPEIVARVGRGNRGKSGAYSLDGAATWAPFATEPAGSEGSGAIAVSADGAAFLWSPRGTVPHYSRDRGATWNACEGLPGRARPIADRVNPNTFYAFAPDGKLYASTDGGAHFSARAADLPTRDARLHALPGIEGDLWLVAGRGLYHSTDGGKSFTPLTTMQEITSLGFGKAAPGHTYLALYMLGKVGGVQGAFRSDDSGLTWVRINDDQHQYGAPGPIIGDPRIYGRAYLGTNGRGILYADPQKDY